MGWNKEDPQSRFSRYCDPQSNGCVLWTGARTKKGYGVFSPGTAHGFKHSVRAHVWAWEQVYGPVPDGLQLDHFACDTTSCVNPMHCRPATVRENNLRSDCVSGINARKTHCDKGREFSVENTRVLARGERVCKTCANASQRRYYERKRDLVGVG